MNPELRTLLARHLRPVESSEGQTLDQALTFQAVELAYLARTFLDWDGPLDVEEIRAELARLTAQAPL